LTGLIASISIRPQLISAVKRAALEIIDRGAIIRQVVNHLVSIAVDQKYVRILFGLIAERLNSLVNEDFLQKS